MKSVARPARFSSWGVPKKKKKKKKTRDCCNCFAFFSFFLSKSFFSSTRQVYANFLRPVFVHLADPSIRSRLIRLTKRRSQRIDESSISLDQSGIIEINARFLQNACIIPCVRGRRQVARCSLAPTEKSIIALCPYGIASKCVHFANARQART